MTGNARRIRLPILATLTLLVLAVVGYMIALFTYVAPVDNYVLESDRRVVVYARLGTSDSVLLHFSREEDSQVTVLVWARKPPTVVRDLVATLVPIPVQLERPLGDRVILAPGQDVPALRR